MTVKKKILIAGLVLLVLAVALFGSYGTLPQDDANARLMRFEDLRAQRYAEIFVMVGNPITKNFRAGVYNSIGLNSKTGMGDSAPQQLLDKMDAESIKKEYGVLGVHLNGPRLWTLDWVEVKVGQERDFNGVKMRWVMWLDVPKELVSGESIAYKKITGKRDTSFGFLKGRPVFILEDPEGNAYVMKSIDIYGPPDQTYEGMHSLGDRLQLPVSWNYRVAVLDRDLVLTPSNGNAVITRDEFGNTYDLVGGPYSNFKP